MSLRKALLAATVMALPVAAQAQPVEGLYVGAGAGLNWLQNADIELGGDTAKAKFDMGWAGVVSLGYGFGNGVRAEIEGSYRQNELDKVDGFAADGKARSYGVMANAFYDFDLGIDLGGIGFVPYVGAGLGWIWHDYDKVGPAGGPAVIDGNQGVFAYQAIIGNSFPIAAVPGLALTAEYRFLGTQQPKLDVTDVAGGGSVKTDNYNHSVLLGIRYAFGGAPAAVPPPVVAPAAAPAVARTYLVFFDFDRADLTDRAKQIIAEAAENSRRVSSTRIEVSGHADRAGTVQYNQRLSQRRAEAVAAELVAKGVNRSEIVVQAFGETRPLVPTADGVREPQNRRVEIVLR